MKLEASNLRESWETAVTAKMFRQHPKIPLFPSNFVGQTSVVELKPEDAEIWNGFARITTQVKNIAEFVVILKIFVENRIQSNALNANFQGAEEDWARWICTLAPETAKLVEIPTMFEFYLKNRELVDNSIPSLILELKKLVAEKRNFEIAEAERIQREEEIRVQEELERQLAEIRAEWLVSHRAIGLANSEAEFKSALSELNRADLGHWDFERFINSLKSPLIMKLSEVQSPILKLYFENAFRTIQHPIVASVTLGSEFEVEYDDGSKEIFFLDSTRYLNYEIKVKKIVQGSAYFHSLTQWGYADPFYLRTFVLESVLESAIPIKEIIFTRKSAPLDFVDLIAYVYSEPTMRELIPLYFADWHFFLPDTTCDACGSQLSRAESIIKSKGPTCGNHGYDLDITDNWRIQELLRRLIRINTPRLLSRNSPLIERRMFLLNSDAFKDLEKLKKILGVKDYDNDRATAEISQYIFDKNLRGEELIYRT